MTKAEHPVLQDICERFNGDVSRQNRPRRELLVFDN